jgi:hypothetical protein
LSLLYIYLLFLKGLLTDIKTPALLLPNGSRTLVFSSDIRFDFRVRNGSGSVPHAMAGYLLYLDWDI